ncbi:MAG: hypothetical protein COC08_06115 [Maribacter sp.]|nr:MAG: hypothetical protein COC08_06115 [Maribacter sp.]
MLISLARTVNGCYGVGLSSNLGYRSLRGIDFDVSFFGNDDSAYLLNRSFKFLFPLPQSS